MMIISFSLKDVRSARDTRPNRNSERSKQTNKQTNRRIALHDEVDKINLTWQNALHDEEDKINLTWQNDA